MLTTTASITNAAAPTTLLLLRRGPMHVVVLQPPATENNHQQQPCIVFTDQHRIAQMNFLARFLITLASCICLEPAMETTAVMSNYHNNFWPDNYSLHDAITSHAAAFSSKLTSATVEYNNNGLLELI